MKNKMLAIAIFIFAGLIAVACVSFDDQLWAYVLGTAGFATAMFIWQQEGPGRAPEDTDSPADELEGPPGVLPFNSPQQKAMAARSIGERLGEFRHRFHPGARELSGSDAIPDEVYDQIAQELEKDAPPPGMWLRAEMEAQGNKDLTRVHYVRLRAAQILEEKEAQRAAYLARRKEELRDKRKRDLDLRQLRAELAAELDRLRPHSHRTTALNAAANGLVSMGLVSLLVTISGIHQGDPSLEYFLGALVCFGLSAVWFTFKRSLLREEEEKVAEVKRQHDERLRQAGLLE